MNQKLTKYAWLLPFISGICWGAAGIFVRTLEHDGLDNFSIISFRMLLAALITGIWILFYNRHLFYVHRRDFWLFIGSGMIGMTALSVFYNISVTKGSLALSAVLLAIVSGLCSVSGCYILPWTSNQTQTDLCNTRTHWLCTGKRSTGKQWAFLEHNRNSLRNSGKLFLCCIWNHKQKSHTKRISFPDDYFLRHTLFRHDNAAFQ